MALRYGKDFAGDAQGLAYGQMQRINGASVRLAPAGHVLGSAQVVVEAGGLRVIASGDYKRRRDPTCAPFEIIPCDVFITEATFALPVFRHPDDRGEIEKLLRSVALFPQRAHLVGAYPLGKAQRVIALAREAGYAEPIYLHGAMSAMCALYEDFGVNLGTLRPAGEHDGGGGIIICPPSSFSDRWARKFKDPIDCFASGWMGVRQRAKQRGVELSLVISDHADWEELTRTICEIDPGEVWITHGRDDALARWAELEGRIARPLRLIGYEDEAE
jgi:putative mRNA 3-end processing factor